MRAHVMFPGLFFRRIYGPAKANPVIHSQAESDPGGGGQSMHWLIMTPCFPFNDKICILLGHKTKGTQDRVMDVDSESKTILSF
jgi:hypothetical protein